MDNFDHESFQQIHEKLLDIFQPYYQCQIASYHPWRIKGYVLYVPYKQTIVI